MEALAEDPHTTANTVVMNRLAHEWMSFLGHLVFTWVNIVCFRTMLKSGAARIVRASSGDA